MTEGQNNNNDDDNCHTYLIFSNGSQATESQDISQIYFYISLFSSRALEGNLNIEILYKCRNKILTKYLSIQIFTKYLPCNSLVIPFSKNCALCSSKLDKTDIIPFRILITNIKITEKSNGKETNCTPQLLIYHRVLLFVSFLFW